MIIGKALKYNARIRDEIYIKDSGGKTQRRRGMRDEGWQYMWLG